MGQTDLTSYLNKHCRFRFRGGKEAFGVIWEAGGSLVFSSKVSHNRLTLCPDAKALSELYAVNCDDVLLAEIIS